MFGFLNVATRCWSLLRELQEPAFHWWKWIFFSLGRGEQGLGFEIWWWFFFNLTIQLEKWVGKKSSCPLPLSSLNYGSHQEPQMFPRPPSDGLTFLLQYSVHFLQELEFRSELQAAVAPQLKCHIWGWEGEKWKKKHKL